MEVVNSGEPKEGPDSVDTETKTPSDQGDATPAQKKDDGDQVPQVLLFIGFRLKHVKCMTF